MALPSIADLKMWVGTLFTKDDWDYNFSQIVSWLAGGNSDLVVNSIKAENGIDLDGAQISNLGAATTGSQAVTLDQATTLLNRSSYYYPFSVASGKVDNNGNAAYLQKDSDTQVTVLAGNVNPDLVCVQSDGTIESVTSNVTLTVSTADGVYNIVKEKGKSITITAGNVTEGILSHTELTPSIGDYYCENSVVPFKGWKYTADGWENVEFCHLGYVTVDTNVATVTTFAYNDNNFDVNKQSLEMILPDYDNGIAISSSINTYTCPDNGYFSMCKLTGASYYNLRLNDVPIGNACYQNYVASGCFFPVFKGDVITCFLGNSDTPANFSGTCYFYPFKGAK